MKLQPKLTGLERILLEEAAYARAANQQQPTSEDVEAGMAIQVLQPPPDEQAHLLQTENKPASPDICQAVRQKIPHQCNVCRVGVRKGFLPHNSCQCYTRDYNNYCHNIFEPASY